MTREGRVPKYKFRVLRQLRVGKDLRQPGELVPEATDWPNLRNYLSLQWIEQIPVTDDDDPDGVEYPPVSPQSRLARVLTPERERPPEVVAWPRKQDKTRAVRCRNCRVRNWLPNDFSERHTWLCHSCAQPQTTAEAKEHPSPTSLAEYAESVDAKYVNEAGELQQDRWVEKGSEDLTEAWKAGVR
jgi:hypothetical protein